MVLYDLPGTSCSSKPRDLACNNCLDHTHVIAAIQGSFVKITHISILLCNFPFEAKPSVQHSLLSAPPSGSRK